MAAYELKIRTSADLKGAQDYKRGLEEAVRATKAMGGDATALEARLKAVDAALVGESAAAIRTAAALREVRDQAKRLGSDTAPIDAQIKSLMAAHGLKGDSFLSTLKEGGREALREIPGGGAALGFLDKAGTKLALFTAGLMAARKGLSEFAQAQEVWAGVDAALAQTGQLTDENRDRINDLAGAMQNLTGIGDDTWSSITQDVIQFGGKVGEIDKHVDAIKNYAGILKGDLTAASTGYRQAMSGNFMMFSRLGFEVDKNASQSENLGRLWEFLAQRGGGQLEARGKTLSGQWQLLKNNTGDVFEAFGRLIAKTGVLQFGLNALAKTTGFVAMIFGGVPDQIEGVSNALPQLSKKAEAAKAAMARAGGAATDMGGDMATAASDAANLADKAGGIKKAFSEANTAMETHRSALAVMIDAQKEFALAQINLEEAQSKDKSPLAKAQFEQRRAAVTGWADEEKMKAAQADLDKQMMAAIDKRTGLNKAAGEAEIEARAAKERAAGIAEKLPAAGVRPDMTRAEFDKLRALRAAELQRAEEAVPKIIQDDWDFEQREKMGKEVETRKAQLAAMDEIRDAFLEMSEAESAYKKALQEEATGLPEVTKEIERIQQAAAKLQLERGTVQATRAAENAKTADKFTQEQRAEAQKALAAQKESLENLVASGVGAQGKPLTTEAKAKLQTRAREKALQIEAAKVTDESTPAERQLARETMAALRNKWNEENLKLRKEGLTGAELPRVPPLIPIVPRGAQPIPGFHPSGLPALPSATPPPSPGFDIRPPGYKPPPAKISPVEYDSDGIAMPPRFSSLEVPSISSGNSQAQLRNLAREVNRQLTQFTGDTLEIVGVLQRQLVETNRKVSTLRSQVAGNRTA